MSQNGRFRTLSFMQRPFCFSGTDELPIARRSTRASIAPLDPTVHLAKGALMRRSIFFSICAYMTVAIYVLAPSALAATDVQGVIDNLKVWLMGFLASLATV